MEYNHDESRHLPDSNQATGYGATASQGNWEDGDLFELNSGFPTSHLDEYGDYTSPAHLYQHHPPFDPRQQSLSSGVHVESSDYAAPAPQDPPPDRITPSSYGILAPSEVTSHPVSSQQMQMLSHSHNIESLLWRPEALQLSDGQPPQVVATALQRLTSANSNEHPNVTVKITDDQLGEFTKCLNGKNWFINQQPEPFPITKGDSLVLLGYVETDAYSRFVWLIHQDSTGRCHCRIPHLWLKGPKKGQPCDHNVLKLKDAIAHVREFYEYTPYPCLGTRGHNPCPKKFYTTERRHDHYCKQRTNPDKKVKCKFCPTEVSERNLKRHVRKKHPQQPA